MNYLNSLNPRDKKALRLAVPVIFLLALLLLVKFIYGERQQAEQKLQESLEDLSWLESNPAIFSRIKCIPLEEQSAVKELAIKLGISVKMDVSSVARVEFSQSPGNQVLTFLEQLSCGVWRVESLQLLTDSPGQVSGAVNFARL